MSARRTNITRAGAGPRRPPKRPRLTRRRLRIQVAYVGRIWVRRIRKFFTRQNLKRFIREHRTLLMTLALAGVVLIGGRILGTVLGTMLPTYKDELVVVQRQAPRIATEGGQSQQSAPDMSAYTMVDEPIIAAQPPYAWVTGLRTADICLLFLEAADKKDYALDTLRLFVSQSGVAAQVSVNSMVLPSGQLVAHVEPERGLTGLRIWPDTQLQGKLVMDAAMQERAGNEAIRFVRLLERLTDLQSDRAQTLQSDPYPDLLERFTTHGVQPGDFLAGIGKIHALNGWPQEQSAMQMQGAVCRVEFRAQHDEERLYVFFDFLTMHVIGFAYQQP